LFFRDDFRQLLDKFLVASIYLARHGWQVAGVDVAAKAVEKARAKAAAAHVRVDFTRADATRLSTAGVGKDFSLILDSGCLHGMSDAAPHVTSGPRIGRASNS
jgi:2-polyprenyl-3-methyl-5-hydroxy-6-metoxy-1,4-benzoquinol methylase